MLFPTIDFAIFFAAVFAITWFLNPFNTGKKLFLIAASYFFYGFWSTNYLLILFGSSVANYLLALILGSMKDGLPRRLIFWIFGVCGNLGVLVYFKYYNFFVASAIDAASSLGLHLDITFVEVALPIAISFLTFHALSYIIDVYQRKLRPTRSLVDILLYISFFPHLVAGPIVRAKAFIGQTQHVSKPTDVRLGYSVFLILGGLFKKVVVANYISTDFVDGVFRSPGDFSSLDLLFGMYAYAIQIYCDFSAYTDIAIGVANLLGYQFPQNFNQPYRALTLQDFWRRWHITLSNWLRDYLYVPLGGNKGGRLFTYRNVIITMGLGGLWHGASFNFIIWGLLHGSWLVIERIFGLSGLIWAFFSGLWLCFKRMTGLSGVAFPALPFSILTPLAWLITFHFVCLTWVFFRAPTLDSSMTYLSTLLAGNDWQTTTMTPLVALMLVFGALTQLVPAHVFERLEAAYDRASMPLKIAVPVLVILAVSACAPNGVPPFIYFQF